MQQEDGDSKSGGGGNMSCRSDNGDDEDELIDMDDCMSGDEES